MIKKTSRRKYLTSIGVATSAVLAGCSSGDGGSESNQEMGERVPPVRVDYASDLAGLTEKSEATLPLLEQALNELGMEIESQPVSFSNWLDRQFNDERVCHLNISNYANNPDRLDPDEFTFNYAASLAGANGQLNWANYANCEVQGLAEEQRSETDPEARRESVYEAHSLASEDIATIPLVTGSGFGAYNENEVEPGPIGPAGISNTATHTLIQTTASDGPVIGNTTPATVETNVHLRFGGPTPLVPWSTLVYSPLFTYNEEYEFIEILAESSSVSEDGLSIEISLRDATFHNGEPVTSEDVQWTFNYLSSNSDVFPRFPDLPIDTIDAPDESTVVFRLSEPFAPLLTRVVPEWGILPKQHFIDNGAEENPGNFSLDSIIGSGPYAVSEFSQGSSLLLEPHDGHPVYSPESQLSLISYSDSQGAARAFENGELNWLQTVSSTLAERVDENLDSAVIETIEKPSSFLLWPQYSWGPSKHRAFRMAVSQAINRERINQTTALGQSEPTLYSTNMSPVHPFYPGDENLTQCADSASSNVETAVNVLEEAGFTFDGDGNLHYPADADLSPRWPEGDEPADYPDQFPCLS